TGADPVTAGLAVAVLVALLVGNALFVAAEFALVHVRRPGLEERAEAGARWAVRLLRDLDAAPTWLATARIVVVAATILLGVVAVDALGPTLVAPALAGLGVPSTALSWTTTVVVLVVVVLTHVLLGELLPRTLAAARPVQVLHVLAVPARLLGPALAPLARALDRVAVVLLERGAGVSVPERGTRTHSLEELVRIIDASGQEGSLTRGQTSLLSRAVALGDRRVEEVMVPRPDVVWLAATDPLSELVRRARETGFSRFPVHGEHEDEVLGSVHVRDLLEVPLEAVGERTVSSMLAPILVVPESARLRRLLAEFRRLQRTAAVVVDEHGGTAGLVTLEDVLEELVGDIEDEFDAAGIAIRRRGPGRTLVDGRIRLDRAATLFAEPLPDGPYETLAGFVLDQLGHLPEVGEVVQYGRLELTVNRLDGTRLTELLVRELHGPGGEG
ncbi:MAG: hemolysin family protein, partial [Nitriliruptoraceae bacterium]